MPPVPSWCTPPTVDGRNLARSGLEWKGNELFRPCAQLPVAPRNTTYQLSFWLAGDPLLTGTVSLLAVQEQFDSAGNYITGSTIGSYNFDTTGHSADNMGYQLVTGSFTTAANAAYVDVELQSTTTSHIITLVGTRRRPGDAQVGTVTARTPRTTSMGVPSRTHCVRSPRGSHTAFAAEARRLAGLAE